MVLYVVRYYFDERTPPPLRMEGYKAEDLKQEAKTKQSSQTRTYAYVHKRIVRLAMRTNLHILLV